MNLVIVLYALGAFLLAVELIVPGGIIGAIGGVLMLGGIIVLYSEYGLEAGILGFLGALAILALTFYVEVKLLPKTAFGKRFFLNAQVKGVSQKELVEDSCVGQECKTVTALSPSGYVLLNGKKVDAMSRSGFIEANEVVKVIGKDNFRLLVSKSL